MHTHKTLLFLNILILSSCGGGGGGGQESSNPPNPTPPIVTPTPEPLDHSGLTPISADIVLSSEYLSGGDASVFVTNAGAFEQRPRAIAENFRLDGNFTSGDHIFRTPHADAGPLLNTNNCQGCHVNDGRGFLPASSSQPFTTILVKIGNSNGDADPVYGSQIQTFAQQSFSTSDFRSGWPLYDGSLNGDRLFGEAFTSIEFEEVQGQYPDGTTYSLRKPSYRVKDLSFGPFMDGIQFSPRLAPHVFGSGLLEAIPQDNILALADENDSDNDGISGKPSMVTNIMTQNQELGRFAYKAQTPSVLQQAAAAYLGDMGVTTDLFPEENCTQAQIACQLVAEQENHTGDESDISTRELAAVEFYNRVLAVPARRAYDPENDTWDPEVLSGRKHFIEVKCASCHTPRHVTGEAKGSLLGELNLTGLEPDAAPIAVLSEQTIYPYTDLLLHDMGGSCQVNREDIQGQSCSEGESCHYVQRCEGLADGLIQGDAQGSEWKTPALWGLGLVQTVNPRATFLHDGRARTIEEAILWHGGEAEQSKQAFMQLSKEQRDALLAFLVSL